MATFGLILIALGSALLYFAFHGDLASLIGKPVTTTVQAPVVVVPQGQQTTAAA